MFAISVVLKFDAKPFTFVNHFAYLDVQFSQQGLTLSVLLVPVLDLELETSTAPPLVTDLPWTTAKEDQLYHIVLELGFLETLAFIQSNSYELVIYRDLVNYDKSNFEYRKWGENQLLYRDAQWELTELVDFK